VLLVSSGARGESGALTTSLAIDLVEPTARVTVSAPAGYPVRLDQVPGTRLGRLDALVSGVGGGEATATGGELVVAGPARYTADPAAQACAPGVHDAVWSVALSGPGGTFELPVLVDRAAADASISLRFCPVWPTPGGGRSAVLVQLRFEGVLGRLTARGSNTWRVLVSPARPTLAPDEGRTFELRALEPLPQNVTLRARHDPKKRLVVLSGRVTSNGEPEKGAEVWFLVIRKSLRGQVPSVGPVKTNATGAFTFRHRVRETTTYGADVRIPPRPCSAPSTAPGGCVRETVSKPPFAVARVRVRR
jgi:hypothetical protein